MLRCSHTHRFVLLRQKKALPSGMGRTFSLGGARSAIFSWTPPSEEKKEETSVWMKSSSY